MHFPEKSTIFAAAIKQSMNNKEKLSDVCILDKLIANDTEIINMVFISPGKYRMRLEAAIQKTLNVDKSYYQYIIDIYLKSLKGSKGKKLKSFRKQIPDMPLEQILLDDFLFFLVRRKHFQDDCETLMDMLECPDDSKLISYLWGNGNKYDDDIRTEIALLQQTYGQSADFEILKQQLHDHLCKDPKKLLLKYDYQNSLENWCHEIAHYFIEGKPRVDLIISQGKSSLKIFLKKECNRGKYRLGRMVNDYKIEGESFITFNDFTQTICTILIENDYKVFRKLNFECSIFAYVLTISKNLLIKLKYAEEKERGLHPKKPTKKEQKEKETQVKAEQLATQAKLLMDVLKIPGSKRYFGIDHEDGTLDAMKYVMEEIHLKCHSNKDKTEKRKALLKKYGKSKSYVKLLEFRAKEIVDKIQPRLFQLLMEKGYRPFSEIENKLYDTLLANEKMKYEE